MCRIRPSFALVFSAALALVLASAPGAARAKPPKENGNYDIKVSGYYTGTGTAQVKPSGVVITATLKDDTGATHKLFALRLMRDEQRHNLFRGRGKLDGMETLIDGRVDPVDKQKGDVLKSGRILFTFKVVPNGRHGRGGGERKDGPKQGQSDSGGPNPGGGPGPGTPPGSGGGGPNPGPNPNGNGNPNPGGNGNSYGNGSGTGPGEDPGNETPGSGGNDTGNPNGNPDGTGNLGTGNLGTGNPGTGNPGTGNPGTGNPSGGTPGPSSGSSPAGGRPQGRPNGPRGRK